MHDVDIGRESDMPKASVTKAVRKAADSHLVDVTEIARKNKFLPLIGRRDVKLYKYVLMDAPVVSKSYKSIVKAKLRINPEDKDYKEGIARVTVTKGAVTFKKLSGGKTIRAPPWWTAIKQDVAKVKSSIIEESYSSCQYVTKAKDMTSMFFL